MLKGNRRLFRPSGLRPMTPSLLSMGLQRLIKVVSRKQSVTELTSFLKGGVIGERSSPKNKTFVIYKKCLKTDWFRQLSFF